MLTLTVFDDGSGPALYAGGYFTLIDGVPAMLEEEARRLNSDDPLLKD